MKNKNVIDSFRNASNGLVSAFKSEKNIRIHFTFGTIALIAAGFLKFNYIEYVILIMVIFLVITAELINTAVEYTIDLVCKEYHEYAKHAKDVAAAATMLMALCSVILGIILFIPKIYHLILLGL